MLTSFTAFAEIQCSLENKRGVAICGDVGAQADQTHYMYTVTRLRTKEDDLILPVPKNSRKNQICKILFGSAYKYVRNSAITDGTGAMYELSCIGKILYGLNN